MRKILHSDADCFYAAVEMRDNPALQGIPIAVGGSASRRGVVATCNYEARAFGIHSAMPTAHALRLCPHLTLVKGRMDVYRGVSRQIFDIYRDYTDLVEPLSLDEAYLDVSQCPQFEGSATRIAEAIRERVRDEVGLTVSIGAAPNKFLAKIASDWRKPDGLFVIPPHRVAEFVQQLPVDKLHGVGQRTAERLHAQGLYTCADVLTWSKPDLTRHFGRFGLRLHDLARGDDDRPVKVSRIRKSISTENTFAEDLPDLAACEAALPTLLDDLTRRFARLEGYRITGCLVKVKFADFTQTTIEKTTAQPEDIDFQQLLQTGWARQAQAVRLLGVGYRLHPIAIAGAPQQLPLW